MIYDHVVKHNGKYYAVGEDVPTDKEESSPGENIKTINLGENPDTSNVAPKRGRPKKTE